jgi:hypothetical protein
MNRREFITLISGAARPDAQIGGVFQTANLHLDCVDVEGDHSRGELLPRRATTPGRQSPEFVVDS